MRNVVLIILQTCLAQTNAEELALNRSGGAKDSMDGTRAEMLLAPERTYYLHGAAANRTRSAEVSMDFVDSLLNKLVGRVTSSSIHHAYMDKTTLAKSHPSSAIASHQLEFRSMVTPGHAVQLNMRKYGIGSSPFEKLAITALDGISRAKRVPDVSMKASQLGDLSKMSTLTEMLANVDLQTRLRFLRIGREVMMRAENLAGVSEPLGFFDPLGFSSDISAGKLLFYREAELKHGRIAMLATLGILVGERYHPFFGGHIDVASLEVFQQTPLQHFWPAVVAAIAIPEILSLQRYDPHGKMTIHSTRYYPLYLGYDPLNLKGMETVELIHGRLAMIAAAGMIAQELATGHKIF